MAKALLRPGTPISSRYVGRHVWMSNSMLAFMIPCRYRHTLSARCNGSSPRAAADLDEMFQDRHRQRRPFRRIGTCTQFVQQDEALRRHLRRACGRCWSYGQKTCSSFARCSAHRRCRQRCVKYAQLAAVAAGTNRPGHRHQTKQPDRFQRHRLAAGIRSGDDG